MKANIHVEIRNTIYTLVRESVIISSDPWTDSMTDYKVSIEDYPDSRPLALLEVSDQVQDDFFSILFPPDCAVDIHSPFGHISFKTNRGVSSPASRRGPRDTDVTARFRYDNPNRIDLYIGFHIPMSFEIVEDTRNLIENIMTEYFDTQDKFTVPHFLIALDRILSLDVIVDWEEGSKFVPNPMGIEKMFVFQMVIEGDGDGIVQINSDSTVVY